MGCSASKPTPPAVDVSPAAGAAAAAAPVHGQSAASTSSPDAAAAALAAAAAATDATRALRVLAIANSAAKADEFADNNGAVTDGPAAAGGLAINSSSSAQLAKPAEPTPPHADAEFDCRAAVASVGGLSTPPPPLFPVTAANSGLLSSDPAWLVGSGQRQQAPPAGPLPALQTTYSNQRSAALPPLASLLPPIIKGPEQPQPLPPQQPQQQPQPLQQEAAKHVPSLPPVPPATSTSLPPIAAAAALPPIAAMRPPLLPPMLPAAAVPAVHPAHVREHEHEAAAEPASAVLDKPEEDAMVTGGVASSPLPEPLASPLPVSHDHAPPPAASSADDNTDNEFGGSESGGDEASAAACDDLTVHGTRIVPVAAGVGISGGGGGDASDAAAAVGDQLEAAGDGAGSVICGDDYGDGSGDDGSVGGAGHDDSSLVHPRLRTNAWDEAEDAEADANGGGVQHSWPHGGNNGGGGSGGGDSIGAAEPAALVVEDFDGDSDPGAEHVAEQVQLAAGLAAYEEMTAAEF